MCSSDLELALGRSSIRRKGHDQDPPQDCEVSRPMSLQVWKGYQTGTVWLVHEDDRSREGKNRKAWVEIEGCGVG